MNPYERQEKIKTLIKQERALNIDDLSEQFQVSRMTIYRDVKPLMEEGLVHRSSGRISLVEKSQQSIQFDNRCVYCKRPNDSRMVYRLILTNDNVETACCAHCGLLRHRQLGDVVSHALCGDFLLDTTVSAFLMWFVMDTTLHVSCCQPQVLPFENKEHAEQFVHGFGGQVYSFQHALEEVFHRTNMHQNHCNGNE